MNKLFSIAGRSICLVIIVGNIFAEQTVNHTTQNPNKEINDEEVDGREIVNSVVNMKKLNGDEIDVKKLGENSINKDTVVENKKPAELSKSKSTALHPILKNKQTPKGSYKKWNNNLKNNYVKYKKYPKNYCCAECKKILEELKEMNKTLLNMEHLLARVENRMRDIKR